MKCRRRSGNAPRLSQCRQHAFRFKTFCRFVGERRRGDPRGTLRTSAFDSPRVRRRTGAPPPAVLLCDSPHSRPRRFPPRCCSHRNQGTDRHDPPALRLRPHGLCDLWRARGRCRRGAPARCHSSGLGHYRRRRPGPDRQAVRPAELLDRAHCTAGHMRRPARGGTWCHCTASDLADRATATPGRCRISLPKSSVTGLCCYAPNSSVRCGKCR
jgi:hypothetical protein